MSGAKVAVVNCEEEKIAVNRDLFTSTLRRGMSNFHFQHARGVATSNIRLLRESTPRFRASGCQAWI